jgi:putative transposase
MQTVRIYRLGQLSVSMFRRLKAAQVEAAQVWNLCMETHKAARLAHTPWPGQNELHRVTKGRFALHSQSVQAVFRAFLGTIQTTRSLRQTHPTCR